MDKKTASISAEGMDKESILSVCYSVFQQFSWKPLSAAADSLVAVTPPEWNKKPQHVTVTAADEQLTVSSEFAGEELTDIVGRNSRNVDQFLATFQVMKKSLPPQKHQNNLQAINALRGQAPSSVRLFKTQEPHFAETATEKESDIANSNSATPHFTYALIALNCVVFLWMVLNGAGLFGGTGQMQLNWGGNYGPFTLGGESWRLLSYAFIHFGLIHLLLNMYCLYWAGVYAEPLLGGARYITVYLCAAVLAGMASACWHNPPVNSAGAAGAVLGLDGLLFVFMPAGLLPASLHQKLRRGLVLFILLNLALGFIGNIDFIVTLAGLLSGALIGCLFILGIRKEKQGTKASWVSPICVAVTIAITIFFMPRFRGSIAQPAAVQKKTFFTAYSDDEKFNSAYRQFDLLGNKGLDVFSDNDITEAQRITDLGSISFTEWDSAEDLAREMKAYNVSPEKKSLAATLERYAQMRKEEIVLYTEMANKRSGPQRLDALRSKIKSITDSLSQAVLTR